IIRILKTVWRWSQLTLALLIIVLESVIRFGMSVFTSFIPFSSHIELPKSLKGHSPASYSESQKDLERDAIELITSRGYPVEEHFVTTKDGFVLGLHRITGPRAFTSPLNSAPASPRDLGIRGSHASLFGNSSNNSNSAMVKPAVLLMHGFMMSSEVWLTRTNPNDSLPFILADAGYDVWLGNNRGNKYSFKHTTYTPDQEQFWNWSIDELAKFDMPSMVDFITDRTGHKTITYIAFSQGTAQGWAGLSSNAALARKVDLFIALAPVSTCLGFSNPMVDSLARSRPDFIFLLFGKKSILPSIIFWRNILPRDIYVKLIDGSVSFLFNWTTACLSKEEKPMLYSHIFSYTSVKTVVHWFQIIQTNRFQMFDDILLGVTPTESSDQPHRYHGRVIPGYHPGQIQTKFAMFYGGSDTLPNTKLLLEHLPKDKSVMVHEVPEYEHLDLIWAKDAHHKVFSKIVKLLNSHNKTILSESDSSD
ncbi:hypothetical protein SAMD00019534_053240, partial [Acytostelium subglobosum LB1]|uniref:hypothetical protein n=1 Tax=Acytostelium subglobosum LB1 TaxID=1410327 RepID=UPI000644ED0E